MARFDNENDDWDVWSIMAAGRWDRNVRATIKGKKGQAILRDLEAALLAMPVKRLGRGALQTAAGDGPLDEMMVCTVGALAAYKGKKLAPALTDDGYIDDPDGEEERTIAMGVELGMTETLAVHLAQLNDDVNDSPERRYQRVLEWVQRNINAAAANAT